VDGCGALPKDLKEGYSYPFLHSIVHSSVRNRMALTEDTEVREGIGAGAENCLDQPAQHTGGCLLITAADCLILLDSLRPHLFSGVMLSATWGRRLN
jgi:hypothetical protein